MVSDYVGYLEKGQIPPKVLYYKMLHIARRYKIICLLCSNFFFQSWLQHLSLVHSQVSLNIEGSKYTVCNKTIAVCCKAFILNLSNNFWRFVSFIDIYCRKCGNLFLD